MQGNELYQKAKVQQGPFEIRNEHSFGDAAKSIEDFEQELQKREQRKSFLRKFLEKAPLFRLIFKPDIKVVNVKNEGSTGDINIHQ